MLNNASIVVGYIVILQWLYGKFKNQVSAKVIFGS
jgi:hypothetical protein